MRTAGSHRIFKHPTKPKLVTVAGKPGEDIPTGTLKKILKDSELEKIIMSVRYPVVYEKGPSSWGAVPDLPGCIAVGATRDEVERLVREAIEAHMKHFEIPASRFQNRPTKWVRSK